MNKTGINYREGVIYHGEKIPPVRNIVRPGSLRILMSEMKCGDCIFSRQRSGAIFEHAKRLRIKITTRVTTVKGKKVGLRVWRIK